MLEGLIGFLLGSLLFFGGLYVGGRKVNKQARRQVRDWVEDNACWNCREAYNDRRRWGVES